MRTPGRQTIKIQRCHILDMCDLRYFMLRCALGMVWVKAQGGNGLLSNAGLMGRKRTRSLPSNPSDCHANAFLQSASVEMRHPALPTALCSKGPPSCQHRISVQTPATSLHDSLSHLYTSHHEVRAGLVTKT